MPVQNKSKTLSNALTHQDESAMVRCYTESRSALRQDVVAERRFYIPMSHRRAAGGGFAAKPLPSPRQQHDDVNIMAKQKPQILDSLFTNLKEQRMRVLSRQNNRVQNNGACSRRPPWGRDRFGN